MKFFIIDFSRIFRMFFKSTFTFLNVFIISGCIQTKEIIVEVPVSSPKAAFSVKTKVYEVGTQVYFENKYNVQIIKKDNKKKGKVLISSLNGSDIFLSASLNALSSKTSISLNTSEYSGPVKVKLIDAGVTRVSKIIRLKNEGVNELEF